MLPEDSFNQGLFMKREIKENISSSILDEISNKGVLNKQSEERTAETYVKQLKVRTPSIDTVIGTLSGETSRKWSLANGRPHVQEFLLWIRRQ